MQKIISECPVCHNKLKAVKLQCDVCDTAIENEFALTKFDYLPSEDLYFVEIFLKCRGNIKEVEKELRISYPTVRSKLDNVLEKLGYHSNPAPEEKADNRAEILSALERGEITPEEALSRLQSL